MTYIVNSNQITETVAPTVEPVSLAEAKTHLRIDGTDSDTFIGTLITAARQWIEKEYQVSLVQRTYRADVEYFAARYRLPRPPLASITSVKYYTDDSPQVLTTLAATQYRADLGRGEIYVDAEAVSMPAISDRHDAVQITYVAGYSPDTASPQDYAANVPHPVKASILLHVGDLFENREATTQLKMQRLDTVDMLMAPYRVYS